MISRLFSMSFMLGLLIAGAAAWFLLRGYPSFAPLFDRLTIDDSPADMHESNREEGAAEIVKAQTLPSPPLDNSAESPPVPTAERIFIFWGEFLLEEQAKTFAEQLSRQSSVVVRAEKVAREYRIALSFLDEPDLNSKIQAIESATGFKLQGSTAMRLYIMPHKLDSKQAAATFSQHLKKSTVLDPLTLQTKAGFAVGLVYADELALIKALQAIESAQIANPNEPNE